MLLASIRCSFLLRFPMGWFHHDGIGMPEKKILPEVTRIKKGLTGKKKGHSILAKGEAAFPWDLYPTTMGRTALPTPSQRTFKSALTIRGFPFLPNRVGRCGHKGCISAWCRRASKGPGPHRTLDTQTDLQSFFLALAWCV